MPYRITPLENQYFYHIFNRGVEKRTIFLNDSDKSRFLKTLMYYQQEGPRPRFSIFNPVIHKNLNNQKIVDIICYCLMPNHFHLLLKQNSDRGISDFLRKISNSYTKYFNTKYKRVGPLLQGPFKAVQITSDDQLIRLSRYIHLNPFVAGLVEKPENYAWSSYRDFLNGENSSVDKKQVLGFFSSSEGYKNFISEHQDYAKTLDSIRHMLLED